MYDRGVWRLLLVLAACGRFGFDARTAASDAPASDTAIDGPRLPKLQLASASNADNTDLYGFALAIARDGTRIVVGAPQEDSNGAPGDNSVGDSGAAYVLARSGDTWIEEAYLKHAPQVNGHFGVAVAIDSTGTRVAIGTGTGQSGVGHVEMFVRAGTTWTFESEVTETGGGTADSFGSSVALDDAGATLVVGAHVGNAIYIFQRAGTTWTQKQKTAPAIADVNDAFGYAVAISGDASRVVASATGEASLVVGNPNDNTGANAGAVYTFDASGGVWSQTQYLKEPVPDAGAFFGYALAVSQDGTHIAAGAPGNDTTVANSGAAYLDGQQLKASNAGNNDQLGLAVAIAGTTVFAGASLQDDGAIDSGEAYRFDGTAQTASFKEMTPVASGYFGGALATSADGTTFAIAAPDDGPGRIEIHYLGQ